MIKIVDYNNLYQEDIDSMMLEISSEFDETILSKPMNGTPITLDHHWLALDDITVVGTVGILVIKRQFGILKSMMVKEEYRGAKLGVSNLLLRIAIDWCVKNKIPEVYLGTMNQFKAAQLFYAKNGFKQIPETELPKNFINNPLDKVFFKLDL